MVSSQEGGLAGLAGLGDLTRSFFAHDAYVGAHRFSLFHIRTQARVVVTGFSVDAVDGDGWFQAAPHDEPLEESIQEVWFVKDAHRFTAWANTRRITARPMTAVGRIRFVGPSDGSSWRARVERFKRRDLAPGDVVTFDTSDITMAQVPCTHYSATVTDRGVPPRFDAQSFEVTAYGTVCPHPDAPWLAIEVGATQRRAPGEPAVPRSQALAAFVDSVQFTSLAPPRVADVLHPSLRASDLLIALAIARARWQASTSPDRAARPASGDAAFDQAAHFEGGIAAVAPNALWLATPGGTVQRLELPSGATTIHGAAACERHPASTPFELTAERHGVWMGCTFHPLRGRQQSGYARLDPATGAVIATVVVAGLPVGLQTGESGVWALEQPISSEQSCRLHAIDSTTNRIARTMELRKSASCRLLLVDHDGLWIRRGLEREQIAQIDAATGAVRRVIDVPEGLSVAGLALTDQAGFWLAVRVNAVDGRALAAYGTRGGLLRIDRQTSRVAGQLIPTGRATEVAGAFGDDVWLADFARTVTRVGLR
jgi:hypothetical protein